jgi:hypothetical protein
MRSNKVTSGAGFQNDGIAASFIESGFDQEGAEVLNKILVSAGEIIELLKQARMAVQEYRSLNIELDGVITEDSNG